MSESPMLTEAALLNMAVKLIDHDEGEARECGEAFLAAQDRDALAEVLAKIADPDAFTGEGYSPSAADQSRDEAMGRAREQIDALLGSTP